MIILQFTFAEGQKSTEKSKPNQPKTYYLKFQKYLLESCSSVSYSCVENIMRITAVDFH